jgi:hypothetical protein
VVCVESSKLARRCASAGNLARPRSSIHKSSPQGLAKAVEWWQMVFELGCDILMGWWYAACEG